MLVPTKKDSRGFTIVELLIVIVVIAILATISIVAYNGVQVRARDALRTDSIAKIKRALELYKADKGRYPGSTADVSYASGWEVSDEPSATFMEYLKDYGFPSGTPLDPTNNTTYRFYYYRYAGGSGGCDASRGGFYVLRAIYENTANKPQGNSMATECISPQAWWSEAGNSYVYHAYEN